MTKSKSIKQIEDKIDSSVKVILNTKKISESIQNSIDIIIECLKNNGKIITMGNGGSAADAQHFAAEFVGRFNVERKSLAAIALSTDTSIITALGNDYGFDVIFSRQCESLLKKEDVVIAISTSGKSNNVIKATKVAKSKGAKVISLVGENKIPLATFSDVVLSVPSKYTPHIQESHRVIMHIICEIVEKQFIE